MGASSFQHGKHIARSLVQQGVDAEAVGALLQFLQSNHREFNHTLRKIIHICNLDSTTGELTATLANIKTFPDAACSLALGIMFYADYYEERSANDEEIQADYRLARC